MENASSNNHAHVGILQLHLYQFILLLCSLCACNPAIQNASHDQNTSFPADTQRPAVISVSPMVFSHEPLPTLPSPQQEEDKTEEKQELALPHYYFKVFYDHYDGVLDVLETIDYVHHQPQSITSLTLLIESNKYPKVFSLHSLEWGTGNPITNYQLEKERLVIPLPKPLAAEEQIQLTLHYQLNLPQQEGTFGKTRLQSNLADWYAQIPPYQFEEGWIIMPSHTVGEYMVYALADFSMDLYIKKNADKVVIAACTEGKWKGDHYHYEHNKARNFTWSASTFYQTVWSRAGKTTILGYVFYNHVTSGQKAVQVVHDALVLFEELFGEYPRHYLMFVEADFRDGMEYDGLFFLDQYYFANPGSDARASLTALSAHETAHQWWLYAVSNNQAREPWLDEALATYSELLFYERYYPAYTSWWWDYRVHTFTPKGWVNRDIYSFSTYRDYVNAVYLRGALFISQLREELGDEVFFRFLHTYAEKYRYQLVTEKEFFDLLTEVAGSDLQQLRQSYFSP